MSNEDELGFDNVDLTLVGSDADSLSDVDLSSFGEIDETVEFPHIKVSTKSLKEFLKVAKVVCSAGGRDVVSKSVCLTAVGDTVMARSTDFDVYIENKLDLINTEKVLAESIVVPTDILIKLIKAAPVNTIFYKKENDFFMRLYGGDIILETYDLSLDKFIFSDEIAAPVLVQSSDLYAVMKDFTPVVTAAVSPSERRILCEKDQAYANYMWAALVAEKSFSNMDLKIKDISVLKTLTLDCDEILKVSRTVESVATPRCVISGTKFMYAFLVSDTAVTETMKNALGDVLLPSGVFVDFIQFYKMVEVAAELPYATGKVGLSYNDDGIQLAIKTKKGADSIFNISGSKEGEVVKLAEELQVQAKLLKIVLRVFASKSSVKLSLSTKGLGVTSDEYKAAVYSEMK